MTKRIILDVDTGTDDAVAIMLAALSPDIQVLGCTTVWGNLPVKNTTDNTLRVLDHIGRSDIPVFKGLDAPFGPIWGRALPTEDRSMGKMHPEVLDLPSATSVEQPQGAIEWLVETLRASDEPVTIVAVGPLTNIATMITVDPTLVNKVDEIIIMGGAHNYGNVTAAAETNIWHDPVAADVVFTAGFSRLVLVPLDATHDALITRTQANELHALGTPAGEAAANAINQRIDAHNETQKQSIPDSAAVHDALCIAYLIDPTVIPLHHLHVGIETVGIRTFGRTIFDIRSRGFEAANAYVALEANAQSFFEILRAGFTENHVTHSDLLTKS